ncbi:phosphatidylserine decarboxylase family protein [Solitalea canadensis]|uniref:Phosphatidylserine decarboxylase proenzyme n=1 Tax=Solitalea canadensis (strain ATCC 29591 / DSM 3403 / JCM 21819 / LMG 8368 / NBRC 15130 / NCIMB 12057 / USAM 9D) TaxID=929556 RepID=H8KLL0_SOLCM|nr:phosphatidylserine decarboxylase family protein [Solitalea canadensis]AFD08897.1 phosphatidylserine decarboxylase precursor-related protein [Solitalea canadensis DSM 3403]
MKFHREGYASLALVIVFSAVLIWAARFFFPETTFVHYIAYVLSGVLIITILQFFRDPSIAINKGENFVLSPADGKVVVIEEVEENEYFKDKRLQVSVFMSPVNVHINRNPVAGTVKYAKYHPGLYLVAWHPKSSTENERTTIVIENKPKVEVLFRQIAGALARRIVFYVKEGDKVEQGGEMGFIKFGSRVDVFLPIGTKINVELNQVVKGGRTVLAELGA